MAAVSHGGARAREHESVKPDFLKSEFSKHLDRLREGGASHGEGVFTVALDKAAAKMGKHALEHRSDWVLKLVQAAVTAGAPALDIKLQREAVIAHFEVEGAVCGLDCLAQAMVDPTIEVSSWMQELCVGLRSLIAQETDFEIVHGDDSLKFTQGNLVKGSLEEPVGCVFFLKVQPGREWSLQQARVALELSQALKTRAAFAPLHLILDGKTVCRPPYPHSKHERVKHSFVSPTSLLECEFRLNQEPGPGPVREDARHRFLHDGLSSIETFLRYRFVDQVPEGRLMLFASYFDNDTEGALERDMHFEDLEILWTKHGVVVGRQVLADLPLGGVLHFEDPGLQTDLTGLKAGLGLREADLLAKVAAVCEPALLGLEEKLESHVSRISVMRSQMSAREVSGFAGGVGALVGIGGLMMFGPVAPVAAVAGCAATFVGTLFAFPGTYMEQWRVKKLVGAAFVFRHHHWTRLGR